jgi:hypothetical protein
MPDNATVQALSTDHFEPRSSALVGSRFFVGSQNTEPTRWPCFDMERTQQPQLAAILAGQGSITHHTQPCAPTTPKRERWLDRMTSCLTAQISGTATAMSQIETLDQLQA